MLLNLGTNICSVLVLWTITASTVVGQSCDLTCWLINLYAELGWIPQAKHQNQHKTRNINTKPANELFANLPDKFALTWFWQDSQLDVLVCLLICMSWIRSPGETGTLLCSFPFVGQCCRGSLFWIRSQDPVANPFPIWNSRQVLKTELQKQIGSLSLCLVLRDRKTRFWDPVASIVRDPVACRETIAHNYVSPLPWVWIENARNNTFPGQNTRNNPVFNDFLSVLGFSHPQTQE